MATRKVPEAHTVSEVLPPTTAATGDLTEYEVTGPAGSFTALLNQQDAEQYGDRAKAVRPANKAQAPSDK